MMSNTKMRNAVLLCLFISLGCGPGEVPRNCVAVDAQLGVPADREWCEGEFWPADWEGKHADASFPICLPPQADGTCERCPTEKVIAEVESALYPRIEQYRPMCQLEHWEFGCMRTIDNAISIGRETDYCCFQVALWGPGCADQP